MGKERLTMSSGNIGTGAVGRKGAAGLTVDTCCSQTISSVASIQSTQADVVANLSPTPIGSSPLGPSTQTPDLVNQAPILPNPDSQNTTTAQPYSGSLPLKRKEPAKKSSVWATFTKCKMPNSDEVNPNKCKCNLCGEEVRCDPRKNGTSSMWAHVKHRCPTHPEYLKLKKEQGDSNQSKLVVNNISGSRVHKYNKKRMDDKCIAMIIKDELPFRFVEKEGFRDLMREAVPEWPILNRKQVAKGILDLFNYEKTLLLTGLKNADSKVSIITDTWTSIQNINYMVVTAHFIDCDWILHKRIISFCPITSHKGEDIGRAVEGVLKQWELKKIFSITVDNASANDVAVQFVKRRLKVFNTLTFGGECIHLRCACHIINLIVKDGLKELQSGIDSIWNCAKYVRSSPARLQKFREYAVGEGFGDKANIPLDVVTRWNNTYLMLEAALKYETTFVRLEEDDAGFKAYFQDRVGPPDYEDWRNAEAFCSFLKKFFDATIKLSAWKSVTSHLIFVEMITLQTEIEEACQSSDIILRRVGISMRDKFNKYWGSFELVNKLIMIANVLDPRYKFRWVKMALPKVGVSPQVIESIETDLKRTLMSMYHEYRGEVGSDLADGESGLQITVDQLEGLDKISMEIARQMVADENICIKNEVDQYLNDKYVSLFQRDFDIAKWWKGCETTYPVLSRLAKDILAVPVSTVASENTFSLGSRIVDPFRSCLTSKMVEALVCTTDWLRAKPINLFNEPSADDLELYNELEEIEKELGQLGEVAAQQGAAGILGNASVGSSGAAPMNLG